MSIPRIGFNLSLYRDTRSGGMLYYALNMLAQFARKVPERLTLFCGRHSKELIRSIDGIDDISVREIAEAGRIFDYRQEFDVLFTPGYWGSIAMLDYPTVHVIPDIQEQYYPEFFAGAQLNRRRTLHRWVARSSTVLITLSDFSKRTMVEAFGVSADKVRVTHLAAHPIFSDVSERGIRPFHMPDETDFLFYPANAWHHKNHSALLDAVVALREQHGLRVPVILAGHLLERDFDRVDILTEIRARRLEEQVFHIGRIDLRELKYLYVHAAALVHPSLFEGFGIPLIEAMSSGCPVLAARSTSIPEVCGECASYFDPRDHLDMAEKIKEFCENPVHAQARSRLGKQRALQFTYERTADQTLEAIREAYCLVGEASLAKRVRSGSKQPGSPILSIFVSADAAKSNDTCTELRELHSEMPDLVEVICLCPNARSINHETCRHCQCITVEGHEDVRSALHEGAKVAQGRYFFFTHNASIPMRSFIYFLADMTTHGSMGEVLHGDSCLKDARTGRMRDKCLLVDDESDALRIACCSNLSFVVRSDALLRILNESGEEWTSFQDMAHSLWLACRRQRIYRILNVVITRSWAMDWLDGKFMNQHDVGGYLHRFMTTRLGKIITIQVLRVYFRLPDTVQEILLRFWRARRCA
jgi:glycosyltransferase involved in cell wall biosynthesis